MCFQEQFKEQLDVKALGYSSVVHLLQAIPCCALEKPGNTGGDWLVYLKGSTPPKGGCDTSRDPFPLKVGVAPQGTPKGGCGKRESVWVSSLLGEDLASNVIALCSTCQKKNFFFG